MDKSLGEFDVDKIDNSNIDISFLGKCGLHLNNTGSGKLALNFIKFLKDLSNADFASKSLSMVHKTLSTLVWRSHGSPFSNFLKKSLQQPWFKFFTSHFFQHIFDSISGTHSTQQRVTDCIFLSCHVHFSEWICPL